ncbi:MAG: DUF2341 domain-containing protein, partial [Anaerolineaceae bacterium]
PTSAAPDVFYLHDTDTPSGAAWYNPDWSYRKKITIYSSQVSADLNYFPVLINQSTDTELAASAQADGGDILFTSSNGTTKLDHEIEKFVSGTGELVAWVEVPSLSGSVNTELYMYYGNASVADQWNINGTWDEGGTPNFRGVWHLDETSGQHEDSTSNGNDSTSVNVTTQGSATGQIDGADEFERTSSNNVVIGGGSESLDVTDAITIEAWIDEDAVSDKGRIVTKVSEIYVLRINWDDDLEGYLTINSTLRNLQVDTVDPVTGYVVLTWDGQSGDNKIRLYRNGGQIAESAVGYAGTIDDYDGANDVLYFGSHDSGEYFDGIIDEVRISSTARTVAWIETSYNNQNSPSTFYYLDSQETPVVTPAGKEMNLILGTGAATMTFDTAGQNAYWYTDISYPTGEDDASIAAGNYTLNMYFDSLPATWYDSAWSSRKMLTIDSTQVDANLTNYPVLVSLTDADLIGNVQADGGDLLFTTSNGTTKLDHEIEKIVPATGQIVAWVELDSISSSVDTDFYMYFDNPGATNQWNIAGTWDSNYIGVWHLDESGNGTLNEFVDSTAYNNHGTGGKGYSGYVPTQGTGQIGYGQTFDGANDFIDMASSGWFDSNWPYRKRIIIQGDQVSGSSDFSNFPVLISFDPNADNDMKYTGNGGHVGKDDGTDIFFTNDEGAKLDHEIEAYDPATGELVAWVEAPQLFHSADTTLYMYYGYASATDQQNISGTWDEGGSGDFAGVWHLDEEAPGTTALDLYEDSTVNANHGDDGVDATGQDGQIDGGQEFNDDYIVIPDPGGSWEFADGGLDADNSDFTVSAWFYWDSSMAAINPTIIYKGGGGAADTGYWFHYAQDTDRIYLRVSDGTNRFSANSNDSVGVTSNEWHYLVAAFDREPEPTADTVYFYLNGSPAGSESSNLILDNTISNDTNVAFGSNAFIGNLDELRISSVVRSSDWIATEFANQDSPSTFYQVLTEETPSDITLDLTGTEITLEAWVQVAGLVSDPPIPGQGILSKSGWYEGFSLIVDVPPATRRVNFQLTGEDGYSLDSTGVLSTDPTWHHVVATYDGSLMRIYIDGSLDPTTLSGPPNIERAGKELWIGHGDHAIEKAWSNPWDGKLDEVRISDIDRSAEWISTEYNNHENQGTGPGAFLKTLGSLESAPSVDIVVTVYHTKTDGSDPQEIVTSSTVTIDSNTTDPYALSIGNDPVGQTFTAADPRLLRVHVNVAAVNGGGSFTLAYDSAVDPSSLDTPAMVIPELTILLIVAVLLIPIVTGLLTKKRRLTIRLMGILVSIIFTISILSQQVLPTTAAPDTFYLHDTDAGGAWYNPDWSYRKKITIYSSQVSADLNYFPVLINQSSDTELAASAQADGGDILFTSSNGTSKLDHEIEKYVTGTGELVAWVEVPSLSGSVNTELYMYYGNASVADQWNITGTWDEGGTENFKAVWHLDENPTDPDPAFKDSTLNINHGTDYGSMASEDQILGQIDGSLNFDGEDDYIEADDSSSLRIPGSFTVSAWINTNDLPADGDLRSVVSKGNPSDDPGENHNYGIMLENNIITTGNAIEVYYEPSSGWGNVVAASWETSLNTGQWYYVVGVHDADADTLTLYVDGVQRAQNTSATATPDTGNTPLRIADVNVSWATNEFYGQIDEVRISSEVRTDKWIETSHNNQSSPSTFYLLDTQETPDITPAGKEMNTTLGSGAATNIFDSTDDEAYWYTDISYPTGGDDASIAAGDYTLNMYFDQLPDASSWWNTDYDYRQNITVTADTANVPTNYSVSITFNHAALVAAGQSQSDGEDIRVTYWNGSGWDELDRILDPESSWDSTTTTIWFETQAAITASSSDSDYDLYYGNTGATSPPADWTNVFLFYDDFDDGSFDTGLWTCGGSGASCTESGGTLTLGARSYIFANASYAFGLNTRWEGRLQLSNADALYYNYWGASDSAGFGGDYVLFWTDDSQHIAEQNSFNQNISPSTPTSFHRYVIDREGASGVRYLQDSSEQAFLSSNVPADNLRVLVWVDADSRTETLDFVRVRNYVNPEPSTDLATEEAEPAVDVIVSVYHTDAGGSDPQEIITSSTVTIDSTTSDPYALDIGSGAEQTFTSADPRLVRVHLDVSAIYTSGSFTLAYDSTVDPSSLDTPVMVVPEWGIAFLLVVVFIPGLMMLIWRRSRLTILLTIIMSIVVVQLGLQTAGVEAYVDEPYENRMVRYTTPIMDDPNAVAGLEVRDGAVERPDLRGRYSTTSQLFVNGQTTNQFVWEGSMTPQHYRDGNGKWQKIDTDLVPSSRNITGFGAAAWEMTENAYELYVTGEIQANKPFIRLKPKQSGYWVQFTPQELRWTDIDGQTEIIATPNSDPPTVAGNEITWTAAFAGGMDLRLQVDAGRMVKWLDLSNPVPNPSNSIMMGGEPFFEYVESISLHPSLSIWVNGQEW